MSRLVPRAGTWRELLIHKKVNCQSKVRSRCPWSEIPYVVVRMTWGSASRCALPNRPQTADRRPAKENRHRDVGRHPATPCITRGRPRQGSPSKWSMARTIVLWRAGCDFVGNLTASTPRLVARPGFGLEAPGPSPADRVDDDGRGIFGKPYRRKQGGRRPATHLSEGLSEPARRIGGRATTG